MGEEGVDVYAEEGNGFFAVLRNDSVEEGPSLL